MFYYNYKHIIFCASYMRHSIIASGQNETISRLIPRKILLRLPKKLHTQTKAHTQIQSKHRVHKPTSSNKNLGIIRQMYYILYMNPRCCIIRMHRICSDSRLCLTIRLMNRVTLYSSLKSIYIYYRTEWMSACVCLRVCCMFATSRIIRVLEIDTVALILQNASSLSISRCHRTIFYLIFHP